MRLMASGPKPPTFLTEPLFPSQYNHPFLNWGLSKKFGLIWNIIYCFHQMKVHRFPFARFLDHDGMGKMGISDGMDDLFDPICSNNFFNIHHQSFKHVTLEFLNTLIVFTDDEAYFAFSINNTTYIVTFSIYLRFCVSKICLNLCRWLIIRGFKASCGLGVTHHYVLILVNC